MVLVIKTGKRKVSKQTNKQTGNCFGGMFNEEKVCRLGNYLSLIEVVIDNNFIIPGDKQWLTRSNLLKK